jgi:hypothetical protein
LKCKIKFNLTPTLIALNVRIPGPTRWAPTYRSMSNGFTLCSLSTWLIWKKAWVLALVVYAGFIFTAFIVITTFTNCDWLNKSID